MTPTRDEPLRVAGAPIMGLRPFVVTLTTLVPTKAGPNYRLQYVRLLYAETPELAIARGCLLAFADYPEIPPYCWHVTIAPEVHTFTKDSNAAAQPQA